MLGTRRPLAALVPEVLETTRNLLRSEGSSVLLLEHRSLEPELHADHIPRRDRLERLWRDLIQEGADSGLYTCADTGMAGRALLGVMNWAITWFRQDGPLSAEQIAEQFADLFLLGLVRRGTGV